MTVATLAGSRRRMEPDDATTPPDRPEAEHGQATVGAGGPPSCGGALQGHRAAPHRTHDAYFRGLEIYLAAAAAAPDDRGPAGG